MEEEKVKKIIILLTIMVMVLTACSEKETSNAVEDSTTTEKGEWPEELVGKWYLYKTLVGEKGRPLCEESYAEAGESMILDDTGSGYFAEKDEKIGLEWSCKNNMLKYCLEGDEEEYNCECTVEDDVLTLFFEYPDEDNNEIIVEKHLCFTKEEPQLDYQFFQYFSFYSTLEESCEWLDEYEYKYNIDIFGGSIRGIQGETQHEWSFEISELQMAEGLFVTWYKWDKDNYETIYENSKKELEKLYGTPSRESETCAWFTDEEIVVGLIKSEGTVHLEIGPYDGMSQFL